MTPSTLITMSGRAVDPLAMRVDDVSWIDIGHALSQINRWNGHTRVPWSVAHHSIVVATLAEPADTLWALLHDASEAYLCDLPRPVKLLPVLSPYLALEARVMHVVLEAAGIAPALLPDAVREIDDAVLVAEYRAFFPTSRHQTRLPAVREHLVAQASDWIRAESGISARATADRWKRWVISLAHRTEGIGAA